MLVAWVAFPLLLGLLSLCAGAALERLAGLRLPGSLLIPAGLAALIVLGLPFTFVRGTAQFLVPVCTGFAAAGAVLLVSREREKVDMWAIAAAFGVFAVFAAPYILSGQVDLGGYIKLDDNASWLALAERATEQGSSYSGLAPSTYEATLDFYLGSSYPLGGLLPLGIGRTLLGQDSFNLYQPYLSFLAALLALTLYSVARQMIPGRPLRAFAAFLAAQPAVLYAYVMWGGFKEILTAALLGLVAALLEPALRASARWRSLLPLAVTCAAVLGVLSVAGGVWLLPFAVAAAVAAVKLFERRAVVYRLGAATGLVALGSIGPLISAGFLLAPASSTIVEQSRLANLVHPLSPLQFFGIWPTGEFRLTPHHLALTDLLIAGLAALAAWGALQTWRARAWTPLAYLGAVLAGAAVVYAAGSPWVDAKALSIGSPVAVLAAVIGVANLGHRPGRRGVAVIAGVLIAGGILWSNALAYHEVNLTPHARFAELETIGHRINGQGPTLMTEYEPFGARYFLRDAAPESASELRRRIVPLRTAPQLQDGHAAEIDAFTLPAVMTYRTLVLRRTPVASRPPSPFNLIWRGRYYEVWQRPDAPSYVLEHISLGSLPHPAAVPRCADVLRLARLAGPGGRLAVAPAPPRGAIVDLRGPAGWPPSSANVGAVLPESGGTLRTAVRLPSSGAYDLFVGGALRAQLEVRVDGRLVASHRNDLNHADLYVPLGTADLPAGKHALEVRYSGPDLHPGSGGPALSLGPLFITPHLQRGPVEYLPTAGARRLCGHAWDWVEALSR